MASKFIRTGSPIGKSYLVGQISKGLVRKATLQKNSLHGADASFCSRKSLLHLAVGAKTWYDLTPESTLYFSIGNAVHKTINGALNTENVLIATEVPVEYLGVHGYIDGIIISAESGELKIIDVKTCGAMPNGIKRGQYEQLLTYALLTGIAEASIIYVSRNVADFSGLLIKEIPAPINATSMSHVARVMAESIVYSRHHIVPEMPDYHSSRSGCGWCPFKENGCHSTDEGVLPLLPEYSYNSGAEFEVEVVEQANVLMTGKERFYKATLEKLKKFRGTNLALFDKWSKRE